MIYRLTSKYYLPISIAIGVCAAYFSSKIVNLPLCLMSGAASLMFFSVGLKLREFGLDRFKWWHYILMISIWLVCAKFGYLNMAGYMYSLHYLVILGAVCGTIVIYKGCTYIKGAVADILAFVGKNTLVILCCHTFAYASRKGVIKMFDFDPENNFDLSVSLTVLTVLFSVIWLGLKELKQIRKK